VKIAAIDIGSNAARMQISQPLDDGGVISFKKAEYVRFPLRLGHDVFTTGIISPEAEVRIFKMLHAFKLLMELHEVQDYMICATSAMREASNGHDVAERIQGILDMKIHIIDGVKEAELINNVVIQALEPDKNYLHIDVGGGSTELNIYVDRLKVASKSFKLGSVRLLEGKETHNDWDKMKKWIADYIDPHRAGMIAVGTGGNISKLFSYSVNRLTETSMTIQELERLQKYVGSYTIQERINKLKMNADRADVIILASQIYHSAMKWAGAKEIIVPDYGLKDGMIQVLYDRAMKRKTNK
jgi:exopolyphosphatase / guanosine-5'-triphosphate,3'-diphosphate pyrophosphatase